MASPRIDRPRRTSTVPVRHRQTVWSASGLHTGRTDISLTNFGRRPAAAHAGMIEPDRESVVAARWLGLAPILGSGFVPGTATVSALAWDRDHRAIKRWNDRCHLRSNDTSL